MHQIDCKKKRNNILLIGPSGSGKSTLINEFLNLNVNKAKEGVGDVQTWGFKEYFTEKSNYCLIDSQGFDYSKPVEDFVKILKKQIEEYNKLLQDYEKNLNSLTKIIIDLHAESTLIGELGLDKNEDLSDENLNKKIKIIDNIKNNEFESFKNDIDSIVFPCCLDILKIEIIKTFNGIVFDSLKPKIEELMATVN